MNIHGVIRQLIADNATAFEIIGDRVYPIVGVLGAKTPYIVTRRVEQTPSDTHNEVSKVDAVIVEIHSVSQLATTAIETDEAVRVALDKHYGNVTFKTATMYVDGVRYLNTKELYEDKNDVCVVVSTYKIRIKR